MISGGFAGGGESISVRKAHLLSIRSGEIAEVQAVSKLPRLDTSITFSDLDLEGCQHPHDDPLVILVVVANKTIHRVLIDKGSSANIIFASPFDKMGIGKGETRTRQHSLARFLWRKSVTHGLDTISAHLGRPSMPGNNDNKIPRCGRPIRL